MPSERSRRQQQVFIGFSFICDGLYLLFLGSRHALGPEAHGLPRPWPWLGLATLVHPFVDPTVAGDSDWAGVAAKEAKFSSNSSEALAVGVPILFSETSKVT